MNTLEICLWKSASVFLSEYISGKKAFFIRMLHKNSPTKACLCRAENKEDLFFPCTGASGAYHQEVNQLKTEETTMKNDKKKPKDPVKKM
ncbi:MAG: hypothetical protein V1721_01075 [Pseudomonadota bacterium]